jgi:cytidyltransferase-like protein
MKKIVLATGGFDPIHSGHLNYLNEAKKLGDYLIVGVNSDEWLIKKKGKFFLSWEERAAIVSCLKWVDEVISFEDDESGSAINAILKVRQKYPEAFILFANGGDRTKTNIPEMSLKEQNLDFVFGVGGDFKKNSSSWILENWNKK